MHTFIEIVVIYGLFVLGIAMLIGNFGVKDRFPQTVVASVLPILLVCSVFESAFLLVTRPAPRVRPCPDGLDEAEAIIEKHRQEMFGGELRPTRVAPEWARLYALTLEREVNQVQRLARRELAAA
jgi:hypothetical protein